MAENLELTVLMPCLNEAETLAVCISKAMRSISELGIKGEVLIADNGSTDGSQEIAVKNGARVVNVTEKGYGSALRGGIEAAYGKYVIMGDADDSYDFANLGPFVEKLRQGYGLVMGNRFAGGIKPGAMPFLNRYLGNPVLTAIGRIFFRSPAGDFHCGLRGFSREAILGLDLRTTGMEFASEMVIKATLWKLKMTEVPTTLAPDGRSRPPHLRKWRDGWRHLRFMLLYSPNWLFMLPGLVLTLLGLAVSLRLAFGPVHVMGVNFDVQTMLFAATAAILGFQSFLMGVFAKEFAIQEYLLPADSRLAKMAGLVSLEAGLVTGITLLLGGIGGSVYSVWYWSQSSFGPLETATTMRFITPSITAMILGGQLMLGSFFLSVLRLKRKH